MTCCFRPATRTWDNSSRLLAKIDRSAPAEERVAIVPAPREATRMFELEPRELAVDVRDRGLVEPPRRRESSGWRSWAMKSAGLTIVGTMWCLAHARKTPRYSVRVSPTGGGLRCSVSRCARRPSSAQGHSRAAWLRYRSRCGGRRPHSAGWRSCQSCRSVSCVCAASASVGVDQPAGRPRRGQKAHGHSQRSVRSRSS